MAVFHRAFFLLALTGCFLCTSCQQGFDSTLTRVPLSQNSPDPDDDPAAGSDQDPAPENPFPQDPDPGEEPPDELPEVPGEPLPPDHPASDESSVADSLVLWLRSDDIVISGLTHGEPVGRVGVSEWTNYHFASDWVTVPAVREAFAFYQSPGPIPGAPSVLLCGAGKDCNISKSDSHGSQLQLAESYKSYDMILGPDHAGQCRDCGGSFTIVALIARSSSVAANYILSHTDGNASGMSGPFMGWITERTFRFSTQGPKGYNNVDVETARYAGTPERYLILARFSRSEGMQVYMNGQLVAEDRFKVTGADNTLEISPILGYRHAHKDYRIHLYEYLEFNKALNAVEQAEIIGYLSKKYQ